MAELGVVVGAAGAHIAHRVGEGGRGAAHPRGSRGWRGECLVEASGRRRGLACVAREIRVRGEGSSTRQREEGEAGRILGSRDWVFDVQLAVSVS